MKIDEAEFESDKDLIKEKILEKIGNKKTGTIKLSTFDMGSLKKTDNEEGEYFSFDTYSEEKDLPKIIKAIEKENELGKIKLKTKTPKKEKRKWTDPLGDNEEMSFSVYDIEFDLEQKGFGKEYITKITFISDDNDLKTAEKFNRFFINEKVKFCKNIRKGTKILKLVENHFYKDRKFNIDDYNELNRNKSALYMNRMYKKTKILTMVGQKINLSKEIEIKFITNSAYKILIK